jgi:hypothetical protein
VNQGGLASVQKKAGAQYDEWDAQHDEDQFAQGREHRQSWGSKPIVRMASLTLSRFTFEVASKLA